MRISNLKSRIAATALVALLMLGGVSLAVEPAQVTDTRLERQAIQLIGLGNDSISYFDSQRQLQQGSLDRLVAVDFPREAAAADLAGPGVMVLADGQVLRGAFAGASASGQVQWDSPVLGRVSFPLDRIARFTVAEKPPAIPAEAPAAGPAGANETDRVVLSNGDVVRGFVQAVTAQGLTVQQDAGEVTVPWDRAGRVLLAAGIKPTGGTWVRLTDGSKLRVTAASYREQKLTANWAGNNRPVDLPGAQVAGIDFAGSHRLVKLADLPRKVVKGGVVFGVPMGPRSEGDGLWLHAPVTVRVELPAGAERFAADAALDPQSLDWADLTLKISDGDRVLGTQHLGAATPSARVNVPVQGRTLTIEVEEGANGPVRDRLTLKQAVVLVESRGLK